MQELLPSLKKQGYDTLCFEAPQDHTSSEILEGISQTVIEDTEICNQAAQLLKRVNITKKLSSICFSSLVKTLRKYVSSKKYLEVAEKIKGLSATKIMKDILEKAVQLSYCIKGIDIDANDYGKIQNQNLSSRMRVIESLETQRISTIFKNLLKLQKERKGVVFMCGALHAGNLLAEFLKKNKEDEVLYYFPHSSQFYDQKFDDIRDLAMNDTLRGHTHLLSKRQITQFGDAVLKEITEKTTYIRELESNSHTQFLSDLFQAKFKAFLRPGHYVDALVEINETLDVQAIKQNTTKLGVPIGEIILDGHSYFAILGVNTHEVAEKIRLIQS